MPAIELLKSAFDVTDLDSGTGAFFALRALAPSDLVDVDYRRIPRSLSNVFYHPLDAATRTEMRKLFDALTSSSSAPGDDPVIEGRTLNIWGRTLRVPKSTSRVAMFDFETLCGGALSAADYLEITRQFGTVFLCEVQKMGLGEKDRARRFITFIDGAFLS